MARRQIGQEHLALGGAELRGGASLDAVAALIDWAEIDRLLAGISASAKGEPGWPPPALFKALLLATWRDLSDVRLAEALDDRASFRRFWGFAAHEPAPERTAFVRFRAELVGRGLAHVPVCTMRGTPPRARITPSGREPAKALSPETSPGLGGDTASNSGASRTLAVVISPPRIRPALDQLRDPRCWSCRAAPRAGAGLRRRLRPSWLRSG